MRWSGLLKAATVLTLCVAQSAYAQDKAALSARLEQAAAEQALDTDGVTPWHMKLDLQLFDTKGKPSEQGTYEEWWAGPGLFRSEYVSPSVAVTELRNHDGLFRTKGAVAMPLTADALIAQVIHPLPADDLADAMPDLRKETFGKVQLDCIMLDQPMKQVAYPPLGLFPTFCFDPGKTVLRLAYNYGAETVVRNRIGTFHGRSLAQDIQLNLLNVPLGRVTVTKLESSADAAAKLVPEAELEPINGNVARIAAGVLAGSLLTKVQPVYPESAKQAHISGTVLLRCIIGRDGHLHHLRLLSAPSPDLAIAAIAAVRQWTYKPYLLNDEPTEVDTTITVNFALS